MLQLLALFVALFHTTSAFSAVTDLSTQKWKFRDCFEIYSEKSKGTKPTAAVLVHGFGCSTVYWRETVASLQQEGYEVHAIDLLGQGRSAKPGRADGIEYSIDLWAELLDEYAKDNVKSKDIVLIGNSLGSLVALSAACGDFGGSYLKDCVKGIGMFNCGVGMNSRNIAKEQRWSDTQRFLLNRTFDLINLLIFGNIPLLTFLLNNVVTKELLRDVLVNLYAYAEDPDSRVDQALVDSFFDPAQDEGSVEALSQIYCNDPGATPMEIHDRHAEHLEDVPIYLVWGDADAVTPIQGGLGTFYQDLANQESTNISMDVIQSGHIPFDEVPEIANGAMLEWMNNLK